MSAQANVCQTTNAAETLGLQAAVPQIATVLVCKSSLMSMGLKQLLEGTSYEVSAVVADEASLANLSFRRAADLFVLASDEPVDTIIATVAGLKAHSPSARVVVFANHFHTRFVRLGLDASIDGFCHATSSREVLLTSLGLIALGEKSVPSAVLTSLLNEMPRISEPSHDEAEASSVSSMSDPRERKLSAREAQILRCLTEGAPNKVIARQLDVAEATIKVHIKAILRKVGAANRTQAAIWATTHLAAKGGASLHV